MLKEHRIYFASLLLIGSVIISGYCSNLWGSVTASAQEANSEEDTQEYITSGDWTYQLNEKDEAVITAYSGSNTELTIDKIDGKKVIAVGENAFEQNRTLKKVILSEGIERLEARAFVDCSSLETVSLPESLQYIGSYCFENCDGIFEMTIPQNVTEVGSRVLDDCSNLEKLEIKANITTTNDMCWSCYSLEELYLPESLRKLSGFRYCYALKELEIPEGVQVIESGAFWGSALETLSLPAGLTEFQEGAFVYNHDISEILVSEGNNNFYIEDGMLFNTEKVLLLMTNNFSSGVEIPMGCSRIGDGAFRGRIGITKVIFPNTVTEIGLYSFKDCIDLKEIEAGEQVTRIGIDAFYGTAHYANENNWQDNIYYLNNYALNSREEGAIIEIREGCTILADSFAGGTDIEVVCMPDSMEIIGAHAFESCEKLRVVIGGKNIKRICEYAFISADSLELLYLQGEQICIEYGAFYCDSLETLIIDSESVTFENTVFSTETSIHRLVIPDLNQNIESLFFNPKYSFDNKDAEIVITNMSSEEIKSIEDSFGFFVGNNIYLNNAEEDFAGCEYGWIQNNDIYYKGQYHICKFILEDYLLDMVILKDGGELEVPEFEYNCYQFYDEGPIYTNIVWDYNDDGIADSIPKQIYGDMEMVALYQKKVCSGDWEYQLDKNDKVIITRYSGSATELFIDKIDGKEIIAIDSYAFHYNNTLETVALGEGIQRLEEFAFSECDGIKSITLPDSLQYIGDYCFWSCDGIVEMTIPEGVKELGNSVLDECHGLKKLDIKASITTTNSMCWDCYALEEVSLPEGLKELSGFCYTKKLKTIKIPDSVEKISAPAFKYGGLELLQIPMSVTEIEESAFISSENLSEIQIAQGNENFYIQNEMLFNKEGVLLTTTKEIAGEVEIPNGCIRIGESAFELRHEITKIVLPDTVKELGNYTFKGCTDLQEIQVGTQLTWIGVAILEGTTYYYDEENWTEQTLYLANYAISSSASEPVLRIREGCTLIANNFANREVRESLEVLYLPDSMQYIGESAFCLCAKLKQVIGSKNIMRIRNGAFAEDESLKGINIQGEDVYIERTAFNQCYSMTSVIVDAKKITMEKGAFARTFNIQNIVLPNLSQNIQDIFGVSGFGWNKNFLFTNMNIEDYAKNHQYFNYFQNCNLYLNCPEEDFADCSFSWMKNNRIYYKGQYHLCKFFLEDYLLDMVILKDGGELEAPEFEYNCYQFYDEGPIYTNIAWDYNEDGIADEMPEQVRKDMELVALYGMEESHTWEFDSVIQQVSCEQDGILLYVCSSCLAGKKETIVKWGHSFAEEWTEDVAVTCTASGIYSHHCTNEGCNEKLDVTITLPLGHSWDEGVMTKEAEMVYTCEVCGTTRIDSLESGATSSPAPTVDSVVSPSPTVPVTENPPPSQSFIPEENVTYTTQPVATVQPVAAEQPDRADSDIDASSVKEVRVTLRINKMNRVVIHWNSVYATDSYKIYRSTKKKKGYKKIKEVSGSKTKIIDKTVLAGKKYYYRVDGILRKGTPEEKTVSSVISVIHLPRFFAPKISVVKKTSSSDIRYIQITLKKYRGSKVEIQYRKRKGDSKSFLWLPIILRK